MVAKYRRDILPDYYSQINAFEIIKILSFRSVKCFVCPTIGAIKVPQFFGHFYISDT